MRIWPIAHRHTLVWIAAFLAAVSPAVVAGQQDNPLDCLALTLYWEAGSEGREGMIAVGWVVLNRRAHPEFPSTVCEVVRQGGEQPGCQFSYWCDGRGDAPQDQELWAQAAAVARELLSDRVADPTGGALFFHAASLTAVPWKRPRERTLQIGNHIYYR